MPGACVIKLFTAVNNVAIVRKDHLSNSNQVYYYYLQMYKTLQLFTNTFTFNTNKFLSIKVIKNAHLQMQSY
jgi:hypothetical protein